MSACGALGPRGRELRRQGGRLRVHLYVPPGARSVQHFHYRQVPRGEMGSKWQSVEYENLYLFKLTLKGAP